MGAGQTSDLNDEACASIRAAIAARGPVLRKQTM